MERKTHRESWKGEESVKERFTLPEHKMVPFLEGEYTLDKAVADLEAKVGPPPLCCPLCLQCSPLLLANAVVYTAVFRRISVAWASHGFHGSLLDQ